MKTLKFAFEIYWLLEVFNKAAEKLTVYTDYISKVLHITHFVKKGMEMSQSKIKSPTYHVSDILFGSFHFWLFID